MTATPRVRQLLSQAREKAKSSRIKGVVWQVVVKGVPIDVTTLAFAEEERAAKLWIDRCSRSVARIHATISRSQVRRTLWNFWRGD